jgi:D-tyrosyl-tRNA(Tyr) deacylase
MRVLLQRTTQATVQIGGQIHGKINRGLVILVGICGDDTEDDARWLVQKIIQMRIFADSDGKMNLSVQDIEGEMLVISQFTLHASTKKGNRPSFIQAARPEHAIPLYDFFINRLNESNLKIETGIFGADMQVSLINDGPVTIWMDSKERE